MAIATDQREIRFPTGDGRTMRGVLTLPGDTGAPSAADTSGLASGGAINPAGTSADGAGAAALLIIYEATGMSEEMKKLAWRFAGHGYASLIPDLFDGSLPAPLCAIRALMALARQSGREFHDLHAARTYLAAQPAVDNTRVGVAGFCMGGGFATLLAATGEYRVAAPFYGRVPDGQAALQGSCPVVASFGGRDAYLRGAGPRLAGHLQALGVPNDVKTYPEAGHGFMTPKHGFLQEVIMSRSPMHLAYHEPSAEDAWQRMLDFFGRHLTAKTA